MADNYSHTRSRVGYASRDLGLDRRQGPVERRGTRSNRRDCGRPGRGEDDRGAVLGCWASVFSPQIEKQARVVVLVVHKRSSIRPAVTQTRLLSAEVP